MKIMNKQEFIALLRKGLSGLPQKELEERLTFYSEMIDDRIEEGLTETTAYALHKILGCKTKGNKLSGYDRFGIVTPWATETIKKLGSSCDLNSAVTASKASGTIRDHILRYAIDDNEDGIVIANVGGTAIRIRALVAVWCSGADGIIEPYYKGLKGDDVYSWSPSQVVE